MITNDKSPQQASTSTADETERLRARIRALEEQLARRDDPKTEGRTTSRQLIDVVKELSDQREKDLNALGRALLLGSIEQLRQSTHVLSEFAERVDRKSSATRDLPTKDANSRLADDVITELLNAVRDSSSIPSKTIDRVLEEYRAESKENARPAK